MLCVMIYIKFKFHIFIWNEIYMKFIFILKFFILHPCYLLKVMKFLVEISQFEFLVVTELQIVVYFLSKNCTTTQKKVTPSFPATPSKNCGPANPPFWKCGRRFNIPSSKRGVHRIKNITPLLLELNICDIVIYNNNRIEKK